MTNSLQNPMQLIYDTFTGDAASAVKIDMRSTQLPGRVDGMADAYRHLLLSAELTRKYGADVANFFLVAHEGQDFFSGAGSAMDLYNNEQGILIGEYVANIGGGYGDVLRITREAFEQVFSSETQPNSTNNFTSTIDSWAQDPLGFLLSPGTITLEGGSLILDGIAVLETGKWEVNPRVNGQEIGIALANWPDLLGNWINDFVFFDEINTYTGVQLSTEQEISIAIVDATNSILSGIEILSDYLADLLIDTVGVENLADVILAMNQLYEDIISSLIDPINDISIEIVDEMLDMANSFLNLMKLKYFDPVVLDMDGDGIELINVQHSNAFFDFDKDGFNEKAGWVAPDDAFLVFDKNSNGAIDDIDEMFGNETISGFDELSAFDLNSDGKINISDADPDPEDTISVNDYYDLKIWHDLDGDGVTDAGELQSLSSAGIAEISLASTVFLQESKGNIITELSTWSDSIGGYSTVADVDFQLEQVNSIPQPDGSAIDLELSAVLAPWSRGYGDVYSLQHAMSDSAILTSKVYQLMNLAPQEFHSAYTLVEEILYEWAGTTDVLTDSRGTEWDGRKLATIEAFTGEPFVSEFNSSSDPGPGSKPFLDATWDYLMTMFQERLIVQGPMRELFPNATYDFFTDSLELGDEADTIIANAMAVESNPDMADYWFKFLDVVIEHDFKERDPIILENGQTLEEALEANDDEQIALNPIPPSSTGLSYNISPKGGTPWNSYVSEFQSDFAALIKDKLGFDLTDIDQDGNLDEEGMIFIPGSELSPSYQYSGGVNIGSELSAPSLYHGPPGALEDTNDFIIGSKKDDFVRGYGGNDILYGGTGADVIYGDDGQNYLFGGAGADVLYSSGNSIDVLYGNDGTDYFYLHGQSHVVDGGKGDDSINLDVDANAQILWGMSDGNDMILNYDPGVGTIQELIIGDELTTNEIRMTSVGYDLEIINDLTEEKFTVVVYQEEIDEVHFADGTVWDIRAGAEFRAHATDDSTVTGWAGADTLLSGAGDDFLDGHQGNDTFIHDYGDGSDTLVAGGNNDLDIVEMNGVDSNNLYFNIVNFQRDLLVTDIISGEQLILKDQNYTTNYGHEFSTINGIDITGGLTLQGTSSLLGEVIEGTGYGDTLIGGGGNDTISGYGGTDSYEHNVGDGSDHIYAGGNNDLESLVMNGVAANDLYFNLSSNGSDLIVTDAATDEQVILDNQFHYTNYGFEFATVNGMDVTGGLTIKGESSTAGEYLYGTNLSDTLIGGAGNDIIYGRSGVDTFEHNVGDGDDQLYAGGNNDLDIVLMNGVTANDLFFNVSNNDLIVTDISTGEELVLRNQFYYTVGGYDFASVNGIDITGGLTVKGTSATAGEFLYGTANGDTLIGGAGNDVLIGQAGTDTFIHGVGDGDDHLYSSGSNDLSIVLMNGVAANDLFFNKTNNDLIVTDNATGEKLTLDNHFYYTAGGYEFGTVNGIDVTGGLLIRGDGYLYGTDNNDTVEGGTGQDILYADDGDDQLLASGGADSLYGQAGADTFIFTDIIHSTSSSITKVKDFVSGTDIIDLSAIASIDEFSDLTLTTSGSKTLVDDNGSSFYFEIEGSGATGLDASDFIFV